MLIDIHTHILPGIDDGARDMEESLAMVDVAINDGIRKLVATPHVIRGTFENSRSDILNQVNILNQYLQEKGQNMLILPGAEYFLEPDLPQRLADGELMTINDAGVYLMVELPNTVLNENAAYTLYEIQLQGVTPIIAHPERNHTLSRHPELIKAYIQRGIICQITSHSITGLFGRRVAKIALNLLQAGFAHIIASDCHSAQGRAPQLSGAFKAIEQRWGTSYAQILACENPHRIINSQEIRPLLPPKKKETIWNRLRGYRY